MLGRLRWPALLPRDRTRASGRAVRPLSVSVRAPGRRDTRDSA